MLPNSGILLHINIQIKYQNSDEMQKHFLAFARNIRGHKGSTWAKVSIVAVSQITSNVLEFLGLKILTKVISNLNKIGLIS